MKMHAQEHVTTQRERIPDLKDKLTEYFALHLVDIRPERTGGRGLLGQLGDSAFGCAEVDIDRCFPPISIKELKLLSGRCTVLVGPNGSGKTTVFDAIMKSRAADFDTGSGKGAIRYGESVHGRARVRIARLNQEELLGALQEERVSVVLGAAEGKFMEEFPQKEIDWTREDAYDLHEQSLKNEDARSRIQAIGGKIAHLFGVDEFLERRVSELSGGEKTKLSLALLLVSEPDILLLDEPTNHLDVTSIAKLNGLLNLYTNGGVSVLSVSHVSSYLEQAGAGGVVEIRMKEGVREVVSSNRPYATMIRDRSRQELSIIDGSIEWRSHRSSRGGTLVGPATEKIFLSQSPLQDVSIPPLVADAVWVLSGDNGSGKTKLMEAMTEKKGNHSFVRTKGVCLAYLPQFWPEQVSQGTLQDFFDYIKSSINPHDADTTSRRWLDAIKEIGFRHGKFGKTIGERFLQEKFASFSGGEQRLLWFLAASIFPKIDALFLDEPTNHMDQQLQKVVTDAIQNFPGAIIFSTHDLALLDAVGAAGGVGNKGSTMAPKNLVFEKRQGKTTITESDESPAAYMRAQIKRAYTRAKRIQI